MAYITSIRFRIITRDWRGAGTNDQVAVTILRDGQNVQSWSLEPGGTTRLDRGEDRYYTCNFSRVYLEPISSISGSEGPRPNGVEFHQGISGHLTCRLTIFGNDTWITDRIIVQVKYAHREHVAGTIDSFRWVTDRHWTRIGTFEDDIHMSTDADDGHVHNPVTLIF
jgi:hypothetical protein